MPQLQLYAAELAGLHCVRHRQDMHPEILAVAITLYTVLVFALKRLTYPSDKEPAPPFLKNWEKGHEYVIFISPDFWWAKRFKNRIQQFESKRRKNEALKRYVEVNNRLNVWVSGTLALLLFCLHNVDRGSLWFRLLLSIAVLRFVSRSFEIVHAFGRDVLQESDNTTGLKKFERIKLALTSYLEIFFYSAAAYLTLPQVHGPFKAIELSLNVGTLTNVGLAFAAECPPFYTNMVFVQVFTTLSLVVLSLASYLSRGK